MYLIFFLVALVLFFNVNFFVKREDGLFKIGLLVFKIEIVFRKKKKSFDKTMKNISLFKNMLSKSKVKIFTVTTYTKVTEDILGPFYYTFLMASISTIRNTLDYYSLGIIEEKYNNVIILEGKNKIDFKCIFSVKIGNIIIATIKWIGELYGKSSRRNA